MADTKRKWKNWITVKELSKKWNVTPRRVSQILRNMGDSVETGYLLHVHVPVYRLKAEDDESKESKSKTN